VDTPRPSPRTNRTRRVPHPVLTGHDASLLRAQVKLKGVVLNKVNPAKREMNVNYYRKALERWGVPLMGVIPEEASLPLLSMKAFHKILPQEPPPLPPY
jgi:hypothetical protein